MHFEKNWCVLSAVCSMLIRKKGKEKKKKGFVCGMGEGRGGCGTEVATAKMQSFLRCSWRLSPAQLSPLHKEVSLNVCILHVLRCWPRPTLALCWWQTWGGPLQGEGVKTFWDCDVIFKWNRNLNCSVRVLLFAVLCYVYNIFSFFLCLFITQKMV